LPPVLIGDSVRYSIVPAEAAVKERLLQLDRS
jgi:hypothetical protein